MQRSKAIVFFTGIALVAVAAVDADLDELVMVQRALDLGQHALAGSLFTDQHHGLQVVANTFVGFLLFGAERHNECMRSRFDE